MGGGQVIHTVCMDTRDAVDRDDSRLTFELGGDNPRFQAIKVSLGSLEFPITQWTVEKDWNRIYFSEGFRVTPDTSFLRVYESTDKDANEFVLQLPLSLNEVVAVCPSRTGMRVSFRHPHGLFVQKECCILDAIGWGEAEFICGSMGRVPLTSQNTFYISETELLLPAMDCATEGHGGYLHIPAVPSPVALCKLMSSVLARTDTIAPYEIVYHALSNKATLQAVQFPEGTTQLSLRLYGSELARALGYPSAVHERRFSRSSVPSSFQPLRNYDFFAGEGDRPPLQLPSEQFAGWMHVELDLGWYAPSQRPMCTGQPLRFPSELELALNRLFFPVPERIPQGMATAHFLMFTDPSGELHNCPVFPGRYTPESLCSVLETEMTRLSTVARTFFMVEYDADEQRFTFVCEVRDSQGAVRPAPFGLVFNHPAQFDPSRLGFPGAALYGCDSYTSPTRVAFPLPGRLLRGPTNIYKVTEIGHQKRLRIQSSPGSQLTGLIKGYDSRSSTLKLRTFAGQLPFAHGLYVGDVVNLTAAATKSELFRYERGGWATEEYRGCPIAPSWGRSGVVLLPDTGSSCTNEMPSAAQVELWLRVRPTPELADMVDLAVVINIETQPFNLCFGLPKSLSNVSMGFPRGATQWGIDGLTRAGSLRLPPFDAPALHSLDHPDYVLIYFDEGNKSTGLQHQYGAHTTSPFCKLVLYPMFREERMLPRDTTLLSGESWSRFTIRFSNPDGTPYHFHGAEFSFSLNFIKVQDS